MEIITREPEPEADSPAPPPWMREPKAPDVEKILHKIAPEETPTEPGYGHGV